MNRLSISDPIKTNEIIKKYHLRAKKSLGQNFLIDNGVIDTIVDAADLTKDDYVIEIGPGIGSLTEKLADEAKMVYAFELDQNLLPVLEDNVVKYHDNVKIINQDFLKVDLDEFLADENIPNENLKVVANLPYYITTAIILKLLDSNLDIARLVLMMQKEVAERITAEPGHREYGSLTVTVQARMNVEITTIVSKKSFSPQPKIDSAVVTFTKPKKNKYEIADFVNFNTFVRACFKQKRKSLWNNLLGYLGKSDAAKSMLENIYLKMNLDKNVRAEQLSISQLNELYELVKGD